MLLASTVYSGCSLHLVSQTEGAVSCLVPSHVVGSFSSHMAQATLQLPDAGSMTSGLTPRQLLHAPWSPCPATAGICQVVHSPQILALTRGAPGSCCMPSRHHAPLLRANFRRCSPLDPSSHPPGCLAAAACPLGTMPPCWEHVPGAAASPYPSCDPQNSCQTEPASGVPCPMPAGIC